MNSGLIAETVSLRRRSPILYAPDCAPVTADRLACEIESGVRALRSLGIGPEDRVAVVLPNGPRMILAFLTVSSAAIFAPLNPQYTVGEFAFLLKDLGARALITQSGFCAAAVDAAGKVGVPAFSLPGETRDREACQFSLTGSAVGPAVPLSERVHRDSVAMLLHSSGTTAQPKLIPLTHSNLRTSAANIARTLALSEADTCLNVMPLFHIHGLVGGVLSCLAGGGTVFCPRSFDAFRFHAWMAESAATWCTAVPTMYQAILARAERRQPAERRQFRMLRSSSAHLHSSVWRRLEDVFACPVLNSYGMTEASHQIASNPLPPEPAKIGTVGRAAGPEVAIVSADGAFVGGGQRGEVVIRGETVTGGYLSPITANAESFHQGWLRTGDEGCFDGDGYLTLIGRLKDIINVGGEKVSPAEIDDVLMQHPAVAQALAFAVPCGAMGERVYAAVVLRSESCDADLRRFARQRLLKFKVPEKILVVEALPKGPTGKPQRRLMAGMLGLAGV